MQKRGDLQGLVKGLFLTGKKNLSCRLLSPTKQIESLFAPPVKQGRRSKFSQQTSSGNLGVCLKREPASHLHLEN